MKHLITAALLVGLLQAGAARAGASEAMHSAASSASAAATKTENVVKRGVKKGTSAVAHGAQAAGTGLAQLRQVGDTPDVLGPNAGLVEAVVVEGDALVEVGHQPGKALALEVE